MAKLFGTDGIRGEANTFPMTPEIALNVGRAVVSIFNCDQHRTKIVIGKDTRLSGFMLESALSAGICSMGGQAHLIGTQPTAAVAFTTSTISADAGIAISASHNPYYDNGIKIFNAEGYKLSDELQNRIEKLVLTDQSISNPRSIRDTGRVIRPKDPSRRYVRFLKDCVTDKHPFADLKIVMDCSNGATYRIAPELFYQLGAEVTALSVHPDGKNINDGCGSEHPKDLIREVVRRKADIGLAFDGDGDRLIAVDEKGLVVSGDRILAICAKVFKQKGLLKNNIVVSTVMSNFGLGMAFKQMGIQHIMTEVGDRHVLKEMIAAGAVIGGEDSGHMIFSNYHTTGDGILTALKLIESMQIESKALSELRNIMTRFPQALINVEVRQKPEIREIAEVMQVIESIEKKLGEEGRVLVRYSGTQPLCRVMVEGSDEKKTRDFCRQIADVVYKSLG